MILHFSCGLYKILTGANWVLKTLAFISPFRYSIESMLKIALDEQDYKDKILNNYDFNLGKILIPI